MAMRSSCLRLSRLRSTQYRAGSGLPKHAFQFSAPIHTTPPLRDGRASSALHTVITALTQSPRGRPASAGGLSHHQAGGKGFRNPWDSFNYIPPWQIGWRTLKNRIQGKSKGPDMTGPKPVVVKPEFLSTRHTPHLRATWLGHACYYLEFPGGLRVLLDPVLTERCSPISFIGPKRYTPAPCQISDLPYIDAVIISHCHYDHLSYPTITEIASQFKDCHFFAPLGNKAWFGKCGISNVTELDWWESISVETDTAVDRDDNNGTASSPMKCDLHCLPAQHFAARSGADVNQTLWAGWGIESGGVKVYFAGDTAYRGVTEDDGSAATGDGREARPHCPAFKDIGRYRGPFDLGLIPMGAYKPRELMSQIHADPFDAVEIFKDTACERAMGIHWGTWVLTDEELIEPPLLLRKALVRSGIPESGVFDTCNIGETRILEVGAASTKVEAAKA